MVGLPSIRSWRRPAAPPKPHLSACGEAGSSERPRRPELTPTTAPIAFDCQSFLAPAESLSSDNRSQQPVSETRSIRLRAWYLVRVLLYRGGLVSSAFRPLRRCGVGCHSQGPRFSSGSTLWPSHDGIRRMRRTNLPRRPCRETCGRHKDSKRTRLIHRPCGDITPPVGGIHVSPVVFYCAFNSL